MARRPPRFTSRQVHSKPRHARSSSRQRTRTSRPTTGLATTTCAAPVSKSPTPPNRCRRCSAIAFPCIFEFFSVLHAPFALPTYSSDFSATASVGVSGCAASVGRSDSGLVCRSGMHRRPTIIWWAATCTKSRGPPFQKIQIPDFGW